MCPDLELKTLNSGILYGFALHWKYTFLKTKCRCVDTKHGLNCVLCWCRNNSIMKISKYLCTLDMFFFFSRVELISETLQWNKWMHVDSKSKTVIMQNWKLLKWKSTYHNLMPVTCEHVQWFYGILQTPAFYLTIYILISYFA